MRRVKAFTLVELLVVVGIIGMLASLLLPTVQVAFKMAEASVCMGNLRAIGSALQIYRSQNGQRSPWIANVTSDWASVPTGTNRDVDPDPRKPGDRSVTSLMFLLVREGQTTGLFVCPSDDQAVADANTRWDRDGDPETASEYHRDFADARNVSYSWQGPVFQPSSGKYLNGICDEEGMAAIAADATPACTDASWVPDRMSDEVSIEAIRSNLSPNHRGIRVVNVLRADLGVSQPRRPDVGVERDNIYTASGLKQAGSREAVSLEILRHLATQDTFLIGPVGR